MLMSINRPTSSLNHTANKCLQTATVNNLACLTAWLEIKSLFLIGPTPAVRQPYYYILTDSLALGCCSYPRAVDAVNVSGSICRWLESPLTLVGGEQTRTAVVQLPTREGTGVGHRRRIDGEVTADARVVSVLHPVRVTLLLFGLVL